MLRSSVRNYMGAAAPTCGVFDQDIQLLVQSNLERTILGILCLIRSHAAVSLGDKRVSDIAPSSARADRQIIRHQDHDAA